MKGFYIYENDAFPKMTDCVKLNYVSHQVEIFPDPTITISFQGDGSIVEKTSAKCSKKDTYDFETGALIALMRMCGLEKSAKAYAEIFDDTAYGDALIEIEKLKEENKRLNERQPSDLPRRLKYKNEILKKDNENLVNTRDLLIHENNKLNAQIESLETQIESLRTQIRMMSEKEADLINYNKSLENVRDRLLNESIHRLRDKIDLKEKYVALKVENEKLKIDCEKLRHGYSAGLGRLVNINGVNYRECDEKGRVVWMTSQPERFSFFANYIDTDTLDTLRGCQKKPDVSKREQMWDDILAPGRTPVLVKREDVTDFLDECTIAAVTWRTGTAPNKMRPHFNGEGAYFFIESSKGKHSMTWWCTADPSEAESAINYIRPMRWDLFEKGRIVIKVKKEDHSEFCMEVFNHFTKVGISSFNHSCKFGYFVFNKDTNYVERISVSDHDNFKEINRRKVVNWEDVR